jgi:hypothetical protein
MISARWQAGFAGVLLLLVMTAQGADAPKLPDKMLPAEPDKPRETKDEQIARLLAEIKSLKATAKTEPPVAPNSCHVSGVIGENARLEIKFEFQAPQAKARIALGWQGFPNDARLTRLPANPDGKPETLIPALRPGLEGLSVQVDDPGNYELVLKTELPLALRQKIGEVGLDLDLPAAVITTLDLQLPPWVKVVNATTTLRDRLPGNGKLNEEKWKTKPAGEARRLHPDEALGTVERLELTWEGQAASTGPALLAVKSSQITVSVEEKNVITTAALTVGLRRGQVTQWQILAPPKSEFRWEESDGQIKSVSGPDGKGLRTVTLQKATADDMKLTITHVQPHVASGVPIGPFLVPGALTQGGEILVRAPTDYSLRWSPRGEAQYLVTDRNPTDGERSASGAILPLRYNVQAGAERATPQPFFDLEADRRTAFISARLTHALTLVNAENGEPAWRLKTTIDGTVNNAAIEQLLVQLPPNFHLDQSLPQPESEFEPLRIVNNRVTGLVFKSPRKGPMKAIIEGQYDLPATTESMPLELPTLVNKDAYPRESTVSVALPSNRKVVLGKAGPRLISEKVEAYNRHSWEYWQWPSRVEVGWQPYRPELHVSGEAWVVLSTQHHQAVVRHSLWWTAPPGAVQLALRVPEEVTALSFEGEGAPAVEGQGSLRTVRLKSAPDREHPLRLNYSFSLPNRSGEAFAVPLVSPSEATGGETQVCVWSEPGTWPELKEGRWEVRRTQEIKDARSYPALVLLATRPGLPLSLALSEGSALANFRVDKALIQAEVSEQGQQKYRARYRLVQLAAAFVEIEVPFQATSGAVSILIDGKNSSWRPVDESAQTVAASRVGRVELPALAERKALLEVSYSLSPGRTGSAGSVQSVLQPPVLRGDPGTGPTRWAVTLPPSWLPLSHDGTASDYRWGWRGWLLALRPSASATELERWITESPEAEATGVPTATAWRSPGEPLSVLAVPQQLWLILCSLIVVVLGIVLAYVRLPRIVFWLILSALAVGSLAVGIVSPGLAAAALYGMQPGVFVLLPLLSLQWWLQRRYRRQVVFLPGFSRPRGSSVVPSIGSGRSRGEPSTIDTQPEGAARPASPSERRSKSDGGLSEAQKTA